MNKIIRQDIKIGNSVITLETGKLAPQANASVVATLGKTVVLATVMMGKLDETKDYFPLQVEFVDKLYAGGQVKGGKWVKRELNPSDISILFGRIIDRSIRPLFPKGFQNEVQLIVTILSNDRVNDVIIPAFLAASTALTISDIPFNAPVSAVRIGQLDDKLIINPTLEDLKTSQLDLLVCTGTAGVNMIECGANIVKNEIVLDAIELAKKTGDDINDQILKFTKTIANSKVEFTPVLPSKELLAEIESKIKTDISKFLKNGQDGSHIKDEEIIHAKIQDEYQIQIKNETVSKQIITMAVDEVIKKYFRAQTLSGTRFDKRAIDEVRPLEIEPGLLPCTHGSALFQRGLTQALTVTTLSSLADKQYLQDSLGETTKRYIHYYSAMPFSTGQTGRVGRPGRREVGHGALAEKALIPVIPSQEEFPYTIILTSEVLSQNGSSSMASTCGSTMSLMDAGVPIKDKVAGISIGMISESEDQNAKYILLTDIAGIEDHLGDMDFKITGTKDGITAIQLDIKRQGLTLQMIKDTFVASTKARMLILDKMNQVLSAPRPDLSPYAPKIKLVKLPEDKIGEVIGSGGKTIKALMEKYDVQIDIDDDGNASISSQDTKNIDDAAYEIESMIKEVQIGEQYDGIVTRVENYGAFVEFLPGREALLHVSEMSGGFLSDPSSIIKVGDKLKIVISGFNDNHQIKLSSPEFKAAHPGTPRTDNRDQNSRASYGDRDDRSPRFSKFNPNLKNPRR
ncbi:polyribonucleotide nucleotidyltransferase [Candidatus Shapirobacteria bacterium RIFOXYD1_FULL_38_32]|uniref:Polyribonucleotide nucleotidyltransferase n=2 Tax=Candidatus Shapironibacteriota TaxID=1752721 RepID=A0A1F7SUV5_9BACT|nr:MAG: polyribonucleotide nucleotidyltransferase [Candidatus Shapirobacteria bacterium RIFOXYB1_FULL_38_38]OGL57486.1 MAG: polyribonucleotide nucleotidyltransferase [Candidatus Shapirobacteria bacterium RIFOXYC1_FULL_38_24]OGL57924.1 MAG: polyribonucleotide nucleotidyltransferase [Candidatus Shapirobacteria bacterium RIFOXYD1_FULL_38_32]HAP37767.1 polyribonucleotide nucleotidyltransferase [Candidatus Shapirobacteria bacterium]